MSYTYIELAYLVSVCLFCFGMKALSSPKTARNGNLMASLAMLLAVVAALLQSGLSYGHIATGLVIGTALGAWMATSVQMTQMPEMVALLNGFGGLASMLVGLSEFGTEQEHFLNSGMVAFVATSLSLSVIIGAVTFTGSLVAWGKLNEKFKYIDSGPITFPWQKTTNAALLFATVLLCVYFAQDMSGWALFLISVIGLALGVMAVIPIGGADMPVVISLLNSYSGLAACATGFVLNSRLLIVAGALVGASGLILTKIMCDAMNRSLANVLFGAFGQVDAAAAKAIGKRDVRRYSAEDAAIALDAANKVIIVPGYGMAVAQAQHIVRELDDMLCAKGKEVTYAIHPVAGRMPGHMNVLLAEVNVPYEKLVEMEEINSEFEHTDVVLVIGANDVINPAARTDEKSPIYGMPILDVDKARTVMIIKRSLSPGFAGIDNELFYSDNTMMLFGDAKGKAQEIVAELKKY